MRLVMFYHSLVSDWNHGNAHFLRGVVRDLLRRGHDVVVHEPADGWSRSNLLADHGSAPLAAFARAYPDLAGVSRSYDDHQQLDLDAALADADVVVVHEWTPPELVGRIGAHRRRRDHFVLFFHDTHHRAFSDPEALAAIDLSAYDGVLAFGRCLRELYVARRWARRAWSWHEAADTTLFAPQVGEPAGDLVWIGNWGDGERAHELLIEPVRALGLRAAVYGVRYPPEARDALAEAGIAYRGWLPNFEVPGVFARFRLTVHIPRRPYVEALPGIPTIRPFEALACGIPLVSAPWRDEEGLFSRGDYLTAKDGAEMCRQIEALLSDEALATRLSAHGRRTVASRHTCAHRVDELLEIVSQVGQRDGRARSEGSALSLEQAAS
jgi:spore maturation protein CgeB